MIKKMVLLSFMLLGSWAMAFPTSYCLDFPQPFDGNGQMYVTVDYVSSTSSNLKIDFLEGRMKGRHFEGTYNPALQKAIFNVVNDPLFGTQQWFTEFLSTGTMSISSSMISATGTPGPCQVDFEGYYCAQINNQLYNIHLNAPISGSINGTITAYPSGSPQSFTAPISVGGMNLTWAGSTGTSYNLDFISTGLSGMMTPASGSPTRVYGIKDSIGSSGCQNIKLSTNSTALMYYGTPTIQENFMYIGSSAGVHQENSAENFFAKVNLETMATEWKYVLGHNEVRGSAVKDLLGNIYFVVEEGRFQKVGLTPPQGDQTNSQLFLYKISDYGTYASFVWKTAITELGHVNNGGAITPAIGSTGNLYVGGQWMTTVSPDGEVFFTSVPGCDDFKVYSSPLVYYDSFGIEHAIFHSNCGVHSMDFSSTMDWSYLTSTTGREQYSSPQWKKNADGTIAGFYSALNQDLYCFEPVDGKACIGWPQSTSTGYPLPCSISVPAGTFRSSPIVDEAGNIFITTKADTNSRIYKVAANCSTITPLWQRSPGADVYPTGVLTDDGKFYVGNETLTATAGTVNAYDMTTGNITQSYYLPGQMSWGSLRVHTSLMGEQYLIGPMQESTGFLPGAVFSIKIGSGYRTGAQNKTFRGDNANAGR